MLAWRCDTVSNASRQTKGLVAAAAMGGDGWGIVRHYRALYNGGGMTCTSFVRKTCSKAAAGRQLGGLEETGRVPAVGAAAAALIGPASSIGTMTGCRAAGPPGPPGGGGGVGA